MTLIKKTDFMVLLEINNSASDISLLFLLVQFEIDRIKKKRNTKMGVSL